MRIAHHPDEDILFEYYRGDLAPGLALSVRAHIELCHKCDDEIGLYHAIGSTLMEADAGMVMSTDALDLALARIERRETTGPVTTVRQPDFLKGFDLPPSLRTAAIMNRRFVAPGVWLAPVALSGAPKGSKTYLLYAKPGMAVPSHDHKGREITVMLHGSYADHKGTYHRGDFAMCDATDMAHEPAMVGDEGCLCLLAQEAAIIPKTWLGWVLKPVARV
ncbi:MAG: ChrR family anti-sigma-E factor [Asticcacaulis sp.]